MFGETIFCEKYKGQREVIRSLTTLTSIILGKVFCHSFSKMNCEELDTI